MAKITKIVCDVSPCTRIADREFALNGTTLYVCGEGCFTRFWAKEYAKWKHEKYRLRARSEMNEAMSNVNHPQTAPEANRFTDLERASGGD